MSSRPITSQSQHNNNSPPLSSLNGNIVEATNAISRSENNNNGDNNATVDAARGIIINRNSTCDERQNGHQQEQRNNSVSPSVHLNTHNGPRMDQYPNGSSSPPTSLSSSSSSPPVQKHQRISPPPPPSSFSVNSNNNSNNGGITYAPTSNASLTATISSDGGGGALSTQELDAYLDLYEQKHGLEPLDKHQVQGLSTMSSLSLLSRLITVTSGNGLLEASDKKTAQDLQADLRQIAEIASSSHASSNTAKLTTLCSLDSSSRLPSASLVAATVSQDDIHDKCRKSSNKGKGIPQSKKQPLSPIREESEDTVKSDQSRRNVTQSSREDNRTRQAQMKDATSAIRADPQKIKERETKVDKAEVARKHVQFSSAVVNKTPGLKKAASSAAAAAEQPQRIDNSKSSIVNGKQKEEKILKKECKPGSAPTIPETKIKRTQELQSLATTPQPPQETDSQDNVGEKRSSASLLQKSKIPVRLSKTNLKAVTSQEKTLNSASSSSSSSFKSCNNNDSKSNSSVATPGTSAAAEKAEDRIKTNQNKFPLKKPALSQKVSPSSAASTNANPTTVQSTSGGYTSNNNSILSATKSESPIMRKIGEGDEVSKCLSLIDGLSGHTTWVIEKLLELPASDEDAAKRFKRLKRSPGIGDFFGVPYIKKEVLAHIYFTNRGISEENAINMRAQSAM